MENRRYPLEWEWMGDDAFLVRGAPRGSDRWARVQDGVADANYAFGVLGVYLAEPMEPEKFVAALAEAEIVPLRGGEVRIPLRFDGADLADVAKHLDMSPDHLVEVFCSGSYEVEAIGFQPGFPYLTGLPEALHGVPRRSTPRTHVPAGSVAITGAQTGIYPAESPGGWNLLGTTFGRIAKPEEGNFPLRVGDHVTFYPGESGRDLHRVSINVDCGEGDPLPEAAWECATSLNIAAGSYAGSPEESVALAREARRRGVEFGAHPGYPDREGFGRRSWEELGRPDFYESLEQQVALLVAEGASYIKPHGAFYHDSQEFLTKEESTPQKWLFNFQIDFDGIPLIHSGRGSHQFRLNGFTEAFADRGLDSDGALLPRREPGATISDPSECATSAIERAPEVQTICLHSDHDGFAERIRAVRAALLAAGFVVGGLTT